MAWLPSCWLYCCFAAARCGQTSDATQPKPFYSKLGHYYFVMPHITNHVIAPFVHAQRCACHKRRGSLHALYKNTSISQQQGSPGSRHAQPARHPPTHRRVVSPKQLDAPALASPGRQSIKRSRGSTRSLVLCGVRQRQRWTETETETGLIVRSRIGERRPRLAAPPSSVRRLLW